jgi:hypothetical protein
MSGIELDFETADRITVSNMKEHLAHLEEELQSHQEEGTYMHPEDAAQSQYIYIPALKALIKYFGG